MYLIRRLIELGLNCPISRYLTGNDSCLFIAFIALRLENSFCHKRVLVYGGDTSKTNRKDQMPNFTVLTLSAIRLDKRDLILLRSLTTCVLYTDVTFSRCNCQ